MVYLVYILADPTRGHGPVLVKVCVEEKDVAEWYDRSKASLKKWEDMEWVESRKVFPIKHQSYVSNGYQGKWQSIVVRTDGVDVSGVYERILEVYYQYALDDYNEWLSQPEGRREMDVDGDSLD